MVHRKRAAESASDADTPPVVVMPLEPIETSIEVRERLPVRCPCGTDEEVESMLRCVRCALWQHRDCVNMAGERPLRPRDYTCPACTPSTAALRTRMPWLLALREKLVPSTAELDTQLACVLAAMEGDAFALVLALRAVFVGLESGDETALREAAGQLSGVEDALAGLREDLNAVSRASHGDESGPPIAGGARPHTLAAATTPACLPRGLDLC